MLALLLTLAALAAAPALDRLLRRRPQVEAAVDGFVLVAVGGLLLIHILPVGMQEIGWAALLAVAAGLGVSVSLHRLPHAVPGASALVILLAAGAVALHSLFDGVALGASHGEEGYLLAASVVLHTLPAGLATWRLSYRRLGPERAAAILLFAGLSTAVGWYITGHSLLAAAPGALAVVQCVLVGALLHVVTHTLLGHHGPTPYARPAAGGAGAGMVALLLLSTLEHLEHRGELTHTLSTWAGEAAAPVLLGGLAMGFFTRRS